jgi:hypothetical protein
VAGTGAGSYTLSTQPLEAACRVTYDAAQPTTSVGSGWYHFLPGRPLRVVKGYYEALKTLLTLEGPKNDFSTARHSKYLCDITPCKAYGEEVYVLSCHSRAHKAQGLKNRWEMLR